MRIDLHTHSAASDGTLPPSRLLEAAVQARLDVIAITDHDTTAGWDTVREAVPDDIALVPGIEFSCQWTGAAPPISLHLLGYFIDPTYPPLVAELERLRQARTERGRRTVELLRADGIDITWDEVARIAAGAPVGRPHIGAALVRRGLVSTMDEAFAPHWLGERYRIPKADTDVFVALDLIHRAGGVTVFAHPAASRRGRIVPDQAIVELAAAGLTGLEVDHPDHTPEQRAHVRDLARALGLVVTGGSDFHGTHKTVPLGAELTAVEEYERLLAAR